MGAATVLLSLGTDLPESVRGVVADCGFTSPWEIVRHVAKRDFHLPAFPLLHLLDLVCRGIAGFSLKEADTRKALGKSRLPVLFLHGAADDFVPVSMSEENYRACRGEKSLYLVPGAGHARATPRTPRAARRGSGRFSGPMGRGDEGGRGPLRQRGALALPRRGSCPGGAGVERAPGRGPDGGKIIFWDILQRAFGGDKIGSMRHLDSTAGQGTRRRENGAKAAPAPRRPLCPKPGGRREKCGKIGEKTRRMVMAQQRIHSMTQGHPTRLLLMFALPLMVGNVFQQLYTVVDTAVVGQFVGVGALASLGAADAPNWGVLGIIQGLTQGFSILMAQHFGAKDYRELSRAVSGSITLCVVFGVLLAVGGQLWALPILQLLNTPSDVLGGAVLYLRIVYGGIPAIMAYNFLAAILRALGDAKTPLYAIVVAALMNVVLDLLFVVGFHWGIAGAAIATVISQVASAVYCYLNVRRIHFIQVRREDLRPGRQLSWELLKLGFPIALQNAIIAVGSMVVQFVINGFGMLFLAGFTATNKLYGLLEIAASSYGFAVTSYVGQNLGARLVDRIKKGMRSALAIAVITSVIIGAAMLVFGRLILSLFISGDPGEVEASLQIAFHYLSIMAVCLPILYLLYIYRSGLMGLGDTVVPMLSGFARWWCAWAWCCCCPSGWARRACTTRKWAPGPPRR